MTGRCQCGGHYYADPVDGPTCLNCGRLAVPIVPLPLDVRERRPTGATGTSKLQRRTYPKLPGPGLWDDMHQAMDNRG